MSFFVASFYACQVLSNPRICRSFVAYFHITQWMVLAKLFQILGPIFVPRILQLLGLTFYSLIYIRQNYKFDILAPWFDMKLFVDFWKFTKTWKDLRHRKNSQKRVKNQKSTDKHSSFDGLIQEDIDLSDIYLAVYETVTY